MNFDDRKIFIVNFVYYIILFLIFIFCIRLTALYLFPFVIGIIIAYLVQKPAIYISKKYNVNKSTFAAVFSVFCYIFFVVILSILIWALYSYFNKYCIPFLKKGSLFNFFENVTGFINRNFKNISLPVERITNELINDFINASAKYLSEFFTSIFKKIPNILICCIVTVVASFYIAKDYDNIKKFVKGFVSVGFYKTFSDIKNIIFDCVFKYLLGYFIMGIITFLLLVISFFILNVNNYFLISLIITIVDILPIFGAGIILLPWSIFEFYVNNNLLAVALIVVYLIIVGVKNFVEPKIIGKQMGINPLFSLIFIFLGLRLGGILGMLLLPITLTTVLTFLRKKYLHSNNDF